MASPKNKSKTGRVGGAKKQPLSFRNPKIKKTIYWALIIILSVGLVVTFAGPSFFAPVQ